MPRQLKVLVEGSSVDPSNIRVYDAPFTVNFAAPIIIEPGNKITLDKFNAVVNSVTSGFSLPESVFTLYYSLLSANITSAEITIPANNYPSVSNLMTVMTTLCNNVFTGWLDGYIPDIPPTLYYRDRGLKISCGTTGQGNNFQIQYATAPLVTLALTPENLTIDASGNYGPTDTGFWSLTETSGLDVMLHGGGLLLEFQMIIPTAFQVGADDSTWGCGLVGTDGSIVQLYQNPTGQLYLQGGLLGSVNNTAINKALFPNDPNAYIQIFQSNGLFAVRSFIRDEFKNETTLYNSAVSNPGALGTVDYTVTYSFSASGINNNDPLAYNVPKINGIVDMTVDVAFGATSTLYARTVAFDMTTASALRAGLALPAGLIVLAPQVSDYGSYTSVNQINMSVINSTFDLAIEVLDLPLQTYQASSNRNQGSRQNIIAYFTPYLSNVGTNTYTYAASCYQWLDIDISYPLNISSLSFRVFNPNTGIDLPADSMSFNLMINTTEY
jgi:hypothetical protein